MTKVQIQTFVQDLSDSDYSRIIDIYNTEIKSSSSKPLQKVHEEWARIFDQRG